MQEGYPPARRAFSYTWLASKYGDVWTENTIVFDRFVGRADETAYFRLMETVEENKAARRGLGER